MLRHAFGGEVGRPGYPTCGVIAHAADRSPAARALPCIWGNLTNPLRHPAGREAKRLPRSRFKHSPGECLKEGMGRDLEVRTINLARMARMGVVANIEQRTSNAEG
jgi:hypothetical protein